MDAYTVPVVLIITTICISPITNQECGLKNSFNILKAKRCFALLSKSTPFDDVFEARKLCRTTIDGGEIATLANVGIVDSVGKFLLKLWERTDENEILVYIGLNDIENPNTFVWFDRTPTNPATELPWDAGQPGFNNNENCVVMKVTRYNTNRIDSLFHDYPCCVNSHINHVVCQFPSVNSSNEESTGSWNDTGMMEYKRDIVAEKCGKDECSLHAPCLNNATCQPLMDGKRCECQDGFSGLNCETITDPCKLVHCRNNGTCVTANLNSTISYNCRCLPGYEGVHCETENFCYPNPCQNNGVCNVTSSGERKYTCICAEEYYGDQCKTKKCSDPEIGTHANITKPPTPVPGSGLFYTNGSKAKYKCDDGYKFVDKTNVKSIVCQGGQWVGLEVCKVVYCPPIPTWTGVMLTGNTTAGLEVRRFNSSINYTCDVDKRFDNDVNNTEPYLTSTCEMTGEWNPPLRRCEASKPKKKLVIEPMEAPGAAAVGTVAIIFMTCELVLVVLVDSDHLRRHLMLLAGNIRSIFS